MSAACALAPSIEYLVAFRALQGVGGALMNPLTLSIIVAAFPRRELGTAIGIWAGISARRPGDRPGARRGAGGAGGLVGDLLDQRARGPDRRPRHDLGRRRVARPDHLNARPPGVALITGGLFLLIWGLIETNDHAWGSTYTIAFLAAAAVVLLAFVAWEARTPEPMVPLGFFKIAAFSAPVVLVAFVGLALFGVVYFITLYFQNVKGWSPEKAGLAALPLTAMVMLIGPLAGKLQSRFSPASS